MMRPKLGIIAGGGALPGILIKNCERETREFVVVALKGQADAETVHGRPHRWIRLGAAGEALAFLPDRSENQPRRIYAQISGPPGFSRAAISTEWEMTAC